MYFFSQLGHFQINNSPLSIFFCSSGFKVTLMEEYKVDRLLLCLLNLSYYCLFFYCYINNPIAYSFVTQVFLDFSISFHCLFISLMTGNK